MATLFESSISWSSCRDRRPAGRPLAASARGPSTEAESGESPRPASSCSIVDCRPVSGFFPLPRSFVEEVLLELGRFRVGLRISDVTTAADFCRGVGFTEVGMVPGDDPHPERDHPRSCN